MLYQWFFFFFFSRPHLMWPNRLLLPKVYRCLEPICTNNSYRHLHQPFHIVHRGEKCEILPRFSTTLAFRAMWFKTEQKFKHLKQKCIAPISVLLSTAKSVQIRPPNLSAIVPIGATKVRHLEKRLHRSAARGQIAFKFRKMALCGTVKAAELPEPTYGRIQHGGRRPNF